MRIEPFVIWIAIPTIISLLLKIRFAPNCKNSPGNFNNVVWILFGVIAAWLIAMAIFSNIEYPVYVTKNIHKSVEFDSIKNEQGGQFISLYVKKKEYGQKRKWSVSYDRIIGIVTLPPGSAWRMEEYEVELRRDCVLAWVHPVPLTNVCVRNIKIFVTQDAIDGQKLLE